jgi:hypothetical protein
MRLRIESWACGNARKSLGIVGILASNVEGPWKILFGLIAVGGFLSYLLQVGETSNVRGDDLRGDGAGAKAAPRGSRAGRSRRTPLRPSRDFDRADRIGGCRASAATTR